MPNRLQSDLAGTNARTQAEAAIEKLRQKGGVFVEAVRVTRMPMAVTDPTLPGNPIVFANEAFLELSGYTMDDLLGQEPYFMNGPGTDPQDAQRFLDALARGEDTVVETVQYRKDGSRFIASVFLTALKGEAGELRHHFLSYLDVTERVEAQSRLLEQSEDRYRTLLDSIDQGFCVIEVIFDAADRPVDFRFLEVNAAFERQTGLAGVVGKTIRSLAPAHEEHWFEIYGRIARTGKSERFELPAKQLGFYYDVYAFRIGSPEALKLGVLFQDVSQRRKVAQSLRQSEERLRLIVENALDYAIFTTDSDGIIDDWHAGAEMIFGFSREEILGHDAAILFTPEDREAGIPAQDRAIAAEHGRAPAVHWHLRKNGGRAFIEGTVTALRDPDGALRGYLFIGQDVTERRAAERALRDSRRRQRALIEGIPQLVWRATEGGWWTWSSPQWSTYTGLTEGASRGLGWLDALHPDDRDPAQAAWAAAGSEHTLDMESRIYHAGHGHYRWYRTRATPVHDDDGHIVEWLGTSTDVDDLRRLQDQQRVLVAELQHRTRNLIAVVQAVADQTLRSSDDFDNFKSRFDDRLAALSRIQGLLSRSEVTPITIGDLVRMELDALGASALGDQVTAEGPEISLRNAIVQTLSLALHELATNARKYGALSSEQGHLAVHWRLDQPQSDAPRLTIDWLEENVPPPPARSNRVGRGYGRKLIERALPYSLGAKTEYHLGETKLRCTIEIPLRPPPGEEA